MFDFHTKNTRLIESRDSNSVFYTFNVLCFSFLFSFFMANLPIDGFVDRLNYLNYAGNSSNIFQYNLNQGINVVFFNEPIWLIINMLFSSFLEPESVLSLIIFISCFLTFFILLNNIKSDCFLIVLLFLFLPQVLKNNVIHIRQGLAISLFLLAWFTKEDKRKILLMSIIPFIHSSFFIVVAILILSRVTMKLNYSRGLSILLFFIVGIVLTTSLFFLANLLGARQGNSEGGINVGGGGFLFWVAIFCIYILEGKKFFFNNRNAIYFIAFYLIAYFLIPFSARVFESTLLVVLLASLQLTSNRKLFFHTLLLFYFLMQWSFRVGLPGLGWGVENYV